jgi:hypothetical protein
MLDIQSTFPELDQDLKEDGLLFVDQLSRQANHKGLRQIQLACAELNGHVLSVQSMGACNAGVA